MTMTRICTQTHSETRNVMFDEQLVANKVDERTIHIVRVEDFTQSLVQLMLVN